MFQALSQTLLACSPSPQSNRAPRHPLDFRDWGRGAKHSQPSPEEEEKSGRLAGNHRRDFLLGAASQGELSHKLLAGGQETDPQFSGGWKRMLGKIDLRDAPWQGIREG